MPPVPDIDPSKVSVTFFERGGKVHGNLERGGYLLITASAGDLAGCLETLAGRLRTRKELTDDQYAVMNHQGVTFEVVTIKFEVDYDGIISEDETFTTLPQQIGLSEEQALEMATRITEKHLELDPDDLERLHITVTDIDRRTLPDGDELQHDPRSWGILDMSEKLDFKKLKP